APGADGLQSRLAHRHPVVIAELLDHRRTVPEPRQRRDVLAGGPMVEVRVDQPVVWSIRVWFVSDDHRRAFALREKFIALGDSFPLRAAARDSRAPAHLAFSLASLSSRLRESWAA